MPATQKPTISSGAIFDPTGTYRYCLWREWDHTAPRLSFILLNPSVADADRNDPTIRRCISFAQTWGYGAIDVVNLFAYCATQPQVLRQAIEPIGKENDRHLLRVYKQAAAVVLAWGNWGALQGRDRTVLHLLDDAPLHCLGTTRSHQPRHPLYLSANTPLQPFTPVSA